MAYGALIDTDFSNVRGETIRVLLERDGYGGTTYAPAVRDWSVDHGRTQGDIDAKRVSLIGAAKFAIKDNTLLTEMRKINRNPSRLHRLTLYKSGTVQMKGYSVPDATTTPRNEQQTGEVTVRAKDRLRGLGRDWVQPDGSRFTGVKTLAEILTDAIKRLGLSLGLRVVQNWRPHSMTMDDGPLDMQVHTDAFYRTGSDGERRNMEAGAVIDQILNAFQLQIAQANGLWEILQPGAFTQDQTDGSDEVVVWQYGADGTLLSPQNTPRTAAADITNEAWKDDSDEVSGEERMREFLYAYDHGAPDDLDFAGGFETASGWTKTNVVPPDLTYQRTDQYGDPYEGGWVAEGEGAEYTSGDLVEFTSTYFEQEIGALTKATEPLELTLRVRHALRGNDSTTLPAQSRVWYTLALITPDGQTYFWIEDSAQWVLEANAGPREELNAESQTNLKGSAYRATTRTVDAPPDSGTLYLRLWNPVWEPSPVAGSQTLWAIWDGIEITRSAGGESVTTYRIYDSDSEEGLTKNTESRIGQGPWKDAPGAILDTNGDVAFDWSLRFSNDLYSLPVLRGRRRIGLQSRPVETTRFEIVRPTNEPTFGQALDYDGSRYWPLSIKEQQERDHFTVRAVELVDDVPADILTQTLPGTIEEVTTGSGGSNGSGSDVAGVASWQGRTGNVRVRDEDAGTNLTVDTNTTPNSLALDAVRTVGAGGTETLPDAGVFDMIAVVNTSTSNATVQHENTIFWPGRQAGTSHDLFGRLAVLFVSDGTNWHAENPDFYEIEATWNGVQPSDSFLIRHVARHAIEVLDVLIDAATSHNDAFDIIVDVLHHPTRSTTSHGTFSIPSGANRHTETLGITLAEGDIVRLKSDVESGNYTQGLETVTYCVDAIRA